MQNNGIKISVIMPVYNVEKYLDKAIKSVLVETLTDFELILVNDGSTDKSKEICEKYVNLDERVKLINQENMGAHLARNNALKIALGDYVCFFDSDDYVDKDMLSDMYSLAIKNKSDLIISGFNIDTYYNRDEYIVQKYIPYTSNNENIECFNDKTAFRKIAYKNFDRNMFYPPWNKLYKTSYLKNNNIEFPITYRDDFPFVLSVIKDINNVTYTKNIYYNFVRQRSESETQKYVEKLYEKREEEHDYMMTLYKYWDMLDDEPSVEMISRRYIDRLIECMVNLYNDECKLDKAEKNEKINQYMQTDNFAFCIKHAKPRKLYLRLMYIPLKLKSVSLCSLMSRIIYYVKSKNIKLFATLKADR